MSDPSKIPEAGEERVVDHRQVPATGRMSAASASRGVTDSRALTTSDFLGPYGPTKRMHGPWAGRRRTDPVSFDTPPHDGRFPMLEDPVPCVEKLRRAFGRRP